MKTGVEAAGGDRVGRGRRGQDVHRIEAPGVDQGVNAGVRRPNSVLAGEFRGTVPGGVAAGDQAGVAQSL